MMIYTKSQKAEMELDGDHGISYIFFVITNSLQIPRNCQIQSPTDNVFSSNVTISCPFKPRPWLFCWFPEICICQLRPVESNVFCGHIL